MREHEPMRVGHLIPLVLALGACGGGGGGGATATGIRGIWETFFRTTCERAHECRDSYAGTPAAFEAEYGTSAAACTTRRIQDPEFNLVIGFYEQSEAAGRLSVNVNNANACVAALRAQSCADVWLKTDPSPACDAIFMGNVPTGGMCTMPEECVSATCTEPQMTCS